MYNLLKENLSRCPHKNAIIASNNEYSYEYISMEVKTLSDFLLQNVDIKKNEFICVSLSNSKEFIITYLVILKLNCIPVLIDTAAGTNKLDYILKDTRSRIFITHDWIYKETNKKNSSVKFFLIHNRKNNTKDQKICHNFHLYINDIYFPLKNKKTNNSLLSSSDSYTCIYTSGSTGKPKGVLLTYTNIEFSINIIIDILKLKQSDIYTTSIPFCHCAGLLHMLACLKCGGSIVVIESFTFIGSLLKKIHDNKVTIFPAVPSMFSMIISKNKNLFKKYCQSLRLIELSSSFYSISLINEIYSIFPNIEIYNTYGLTEAPRITYHQLPRNKKLWMSAGKQNKNISIKLLNSEYNECKPGEVGEIYVSGKNVAVSYFINGELSNDDFAGEWFKTGDIAYLDEENKLFLKGRIDEMIKIGAERVYPIEVENLIYTINGIKEVVVYDVDDTLLGNQLHAKIVKTDKDLTLDDIILHCRKSLERFKVPKKIEFCDSIEKLDSGKIDRKRLVS